MSEPEYDEYEFRPAIIVDGLPVPEIGLYGIRDFKWGHIPRREDKSTERPADSFVLQILSLAEEYDRLMQAVNWTPNDIGRVKHIEDHLDRNEVVCNCGKE